MEELEGPCVGERIRPTCYAREGEQAALRETSYRTAGWVPLAQRPLKIMLSHPEALQERGRDLGNCSPVNSLVGTQH